MPSLKFLAVAITLSVVLIGAPQANALGLGECASIEAMTAKLKSEGQQSLAFGSARAPGAKAGSPATTTLIVSTAASGGRGYVLQTDRRLGDGALKMCVRNRLAKVKVFDTQIASVPASALVKSTEDAARKRCSSLVAGGGAPEGCGYLNNILGKLEVNGERLLLQGRNQRKDAGGSYSEDGVLITILVSIGIATQETSVDTAASINYSTPEGATVLNTVFVNARLTEASQKLVSPLN